MRHFFQKLYNILLILLAPLIDSPIKHTMKIKSFVLILISGFVYIMMCSYDDGPGTHGWDCTGAETGLGNPSGCYQNNGCHGNSTSATAAINVALELDSAGVPTTQYVGGGLYTVKITGTNNSTFNLPKYGFQIGCIQGATAVTTPTNRGTWTTPLPTGTHIANPQAGNFVVRVVENASALSPTTGTGATGTIYSKTFTWTAPAAGTGTISFWAALNAVNNDDTNTTADKWNKIHIVITELTVPAGIDDPNHLGSSISVYPNPVSDHLNINYKIDRRGMTDIKLFDVNGRMAALLSSESKSPGDYEDHLTLPFILPDGIYFLEISTETNKQVKRILVQR